MLGTLESEHLKVTALNLFHPTASLPFEKAGFFVLRHNLLGREALLRGGRYERSLDPKQDETIWMKSE